jgi:hypothetical protein
VQDRLVVDPKKEFHLQIQIHSVNEEPPVKEVTKKHPYKTGKYN